MQIRTIEYFVALARERHFGRAAEAAAAFAAIGGRSAILEAAAPFIRELSVICARDWDGRMAVYPVGENSHEGGVLRVTTAPAIADEKTLVRSRAIAEAILDGLDYVGVMGVELFDLGDGVLLVNEIAPRVHNTGHWTQDGCVCDQFEQHIRAVAGLPLANGARHSDCVMQNLIGDDIADVFQVHVAGDELRIRVGDGDNRFAKVIFLGAGGPPEGAGARGLAADGSYF